jgi:hypothetical protein
MRRSHSKAARRADEIFQAYLSTLRACYTATVVLNVLDARCPTSGYFQPFTSIVKDKLVFVLNKADLVPRECVRGWLRRFAEESETIAVVATTDITPLLDKLQALRPSKVAITGLTNTGRRTLAEKLGNSYDVTVTEPWTWLIDTPEHFVVGHKKNCSFINALTVIERFSVQSFLAAFNFHTVEAAARALLPSTLPRSAATQQFFARFTNHELLFYNKPPAQYLVRPQPSSPAQEAVLKLSPPHDSVSSQFLVMTDMEVNSFLPNVLEKFIAWIDEDDNE